MTRPVPGRVTGWLLPLAALSSLAIARAGVLDERDPYWQIRAGLENLDGAPLSRADTWSWAPVAGDFTQTSPGWNDVLALAWRTAGFAGFFAVTLLSLLAFLTVSLALAAALGARPLPALAGATVCLVLVLPMLSPRAALVAQTLYLATVLLAHRWRSRAASGSMPVVVGVAGVGVLVVVAAGMWVHLSWLLLAPALWLALVCLLAATPAVAPRRRLLLAAGLGVGTVGGVALGPYGFRAWELSRAVQEACRGLVLEWAPPTDPGLASRWLPPAVLALALAGWGVRRLRAQWSRRRDGGRARLLSALLVLGVPAAVGGLLAVRFVGVALLTLAPVAAMAAEGAARRVAARAAQPDPTGVFRSSRVRAWSQERPWRVVTTLVVAALLPLTLVAGSRLGRPVSIEEALPSLPQGCRLFSDPAAAAPVLLLRPDVRVWTDTRADYWGRARNLEALAVLRSPDRGHPALAGATCALLDSAAAVDTSQVTSLLDADRAWAAVGAGETVRVWVRR